MARINRDRINAAFELGFFDKVPLDYKQRLCFHSSILTCADVLHAIQRRGDDGADIDQITHDIDIHTNTAFTYCRELDRLGLIITQQYEPDGDDGRPQNVYFAIQS